MKALLALITVSVGVVAAGPAKAQESPATWFEDACKSSGSGSLAPSEVLAVILTQSGVPWSPLMIRTFNQVVSGAQGVSLLDGAADDSDDRIRDAARRIIQNGPGQPVGGITVVTTLNGRPIETAGDIDSVASAYLRGDFHGITIECPQPPSDGPGPGRTGGPATSRLIRLVVTSGPDDLWLPLASRGFGTFGYTDDREAGSQSITADVVIGTEPFDLGPTSWAAYVDYQRNTSSAAPQNDLAFGLRGEWTDDSHRLSWAGSYETDDEFESSLYRAELGWEPPRLALCSTMAGSDPRQYFVCRGGLWADYASIADPGDKTSLLGVEDYLRVGGWANILFGRRFQTGAFEAEAGYELMEPITGDYGDAARGFASLRYIPGDTSNFSFSVTYEAGEDITSLVRSELIKIELGVRY